MISERTKSALTAAKARGMKLGTHRPNHWTGTTEQHRNAASIARKAAAKAHANAAGPLYSEIRPIIASMKSEGSTLQAIADKLNADGHTTLRGAAWNRMQVSRLLN